MKIINTEIKLSTIMLNEYLRTLADLRGLTTGELILHLRKDLENDVYLGSLNIGVGTKNIHFGDNILTFEIFFKDKVWVAVEIFSVYDAFCYLLITGCEFKVINHEITL